MPTSSVEAQCAHHDTVEHHSAGGDVIGGDCRSCGKRYGVAVCTGCSERKRVWIAVTGQDEVMRFCSEDCVQHYRKRRNKSAARTVGGKGRK